MSNRVLHGRLLGRRRTTDEMVRLIDVNGALPRPPDRQAPLCCRWISDSDGRLVCVWERSFAPINFQLGR
ncbi:MAG: hypothetical protein JOY64_02465 [Alphaproteobacteria bacterium]|nr:hypothetical protein [Alphaproteobacteria bacterium]MBV8406466.1 hypothetical protein [Alphaproteobacteria bacterium]